MDVKSTVSVSFVISICLIASALIWLIWVLKFIVKAVVI